MPIKEISVPAPEIVEQSEENKEPEEKAEEPQETVAKPKRVRRTAAEIAHDKAEKEAKKQEREAKKQEKEQKKQEQKKPEEEHKEPCNTCRKTVSIGKHKCKKEDVNALPKPPTIEQKFPAEATYVSGDSDDEPLTYQEVLRIRQAERKRMAALSQVRPLQAWYKRK